MPRRLYRSISVPIRDGLTWNEMWMGPDRGLIWCWERGRQKGLEKPELAARATKGELPVMSWKGGVQKKLEGPKFGTLNYLATWQGLRAEDLDILLDEEHTIECSRTGQAVVFTATVPEEDEE